ncbi:hypothetical protein D7003_07420 [Arthrobacter oryzae]|uniref:Uncharacterized protein n=1 Tax=Arthrobacter oryzae TaxID=409290 RepID=A0A3N0C4A7_9MICC|nr:hypothetical protein D7003_07420 [Arthrobacter oryzae]
MLHRLRPSDAHVMAEPACRGGVLPEGLDQQAAGMGESPVLVIRARPGKHRNSVRRHQTQVGPIGDAGEAGSATDFHCPPKGGKHRDPAQHIRAWAAGA